MRAKQRILILSLVFLSGIGVALSSAKIVKAEDSTISKEQSGAISQSCDSIKQSLRKLQKADTKTRSYLGNIYEEFFTDFIGPLNLRLTKNNLPSPTLTELHSKLLSTRQDFTKKFTLYAQDLEALISIDCQNSPSEFYTKLQATRKSRAALEQTTEAFRMLLEKYQNTVQALKEAL